MSAYTVCYSRMVWGINNPRAPAVPSVNQMQYPWCNMLQCLTLPSFWKGFALPYTWTWLVLVNILAVFQTTVKPVKVFHLQEKTWHSVVTHVYSIHVLSYTCLHPSPYWKRMQWPMVTENNFKSLTCSKVIHIFYLMHKLFSSCTVLQQNIYM